MSKALRFAGSGVLALGLIGASPALAQESDDVRKEIEALKQGQRNIQRQLNEIKRLIQQQGQKQQPPRRQGPQVKDVVFNLGTNEVKGARDAKLTLLEFTDYQ